MKNVMCYRKKIFFLLLFIPVLIAMYQPEPVFSADWEPVLPSMEKGIPMGFQDGFMLEPNVLLLIDTSGSMTFETESDNTTYGDGSRPRFRKEGDQGREIEGIYFGKDLDISNNDPSDPDNYHPMLRFIDETSGDLPSYAYTSTNFVLDQLNYGDKESYFAKSENRYLYPNDSRLYKVKLVLWRIFQDPSLISNLRVSLSTYFQNEGLAFSDWYRWEPWVEWEWDPGWGWYQIGGDLQETYWTSGSSNNYALKRESFESTSDPDHLNRLKVWIDGADYHNIPGYDDNPELRADGNTPLASSIFNSTKKNDCAYDFFEENGVIQGWCQDNYLIVLTDGADTDPGVSNHLTEPVARTRSLYENSGTIGTFFNKNNYPVKTLVIGFIDPESTNQEILDLKDTLNDMADVGWDGINDNNGPRGENDPDQAYFANDVTTLLQAFRDIFTMIQQKSGSGGAPLISPGSKTSGEAATVYVASYVPDTDDQWIGRFQKYPLVDGGISTIPEWDAGEKLNDLSYSSRNVYTVDRNSGQNMVDFTDSNVAALKTLMVDNPKIEVVSNPLFTNQDWAAFIRWVLGSNEYGTGNSERWKLGDIFHSGLTEVGQPKGENTYGPYREFVKNNKDRNKMVYVQGNDGMLHAFNALTDIDKGINGGVEHWSFIPPNVLECGRIIGLRGTYAKTGGQPWQYNPVDTSGSIPRYLLDGPLVAEDIYDEEQGEWKTVLLGLLGYAGSGMYCMDITDPDSPEFMWAVENASYRPDGTFRKNVNYRRIIHWQSGHNGAVSRDVYEHQDISDTFDYRVMRFTLSVPVIGSMSLTGFDGNKDTRWIALMGNGSDMKIDNVNEGYVYAIDMLNGQIVNRFKFSNDMKMIVSPVTVLDTSESQKIQVFYVGDNNGSIYEAKEGDNWSGRKIINLQGAIGPSYRMEVGRFQGDPWLFIVTGDNPDENVVYGSSGLGNFAVAVNTSYSSGTLNMKSDLTEIDPDDPESVSNVSGAGWYFGFESDEYPTTPAKLYNGYIFFSTFDGDEDPCKIGTSRLYIIDGRTGKGAWLDGEGNFNKYVELSGNQVSGITISEGKVYVGVIDHSGGGTQGLPDAFDNLDASMENNLLVFDVPSAVSSTSFPIESGQMIPRYWREWIRR